MPVPSRSKISKKQIALIQIAKNDLKLSDAEYRKILDVGGSNSSKMLDQLGFEIVMQIMIAKGFKSPFNKKFFGHRKGMASPSQLMLIRELWNEYTQGVATEAELQKWLDHFFKVSSLRFLTSANAGKAITALKEMKRRKRSA